MKVLEKIRVILPHWIEHNRGHGKEYADWAKQLEDSGQEEIADLLKKAQSAIGKADAALNKALEKAGGPPEGHDHGHHHHHNLPE